MLCSSEELQNFLISVRQECCHLTEVIQDVINRFPRQTSQVRPLVIWLQQVAIIQSLSSTCCPASRSLSLPGSPRSSSSPLTLKGKPRPSATSSSSRPKTCRKKSHVSAICSARSTHARTQTHGHVQAQFSFFTSSPLVLLLLLVAVVGGVFWVTKIRKMTNLAPTY